MNKPEILKKQIAQLTEKYGDLNKIITAYDESIKRRNERLSEDNFEQEMDELKATTKSLLTNREVNNA